MKNKITVRTVTFKSHQVKKISQSQSIVKLGVIKGLEKFEQLVLPKFKKFIQG